MFKSAQDQSKKSIQNGRDVLHHIIFGKCRGPREDKANNVKQYL